MELLNNPTTYEPFVAPERAADFLALSRKTVLKLARLVEAPVAPWVSDRSPLDVSGSPLRRLILRRAGGRPAG